MELTVCMYMCMYVPSHMWLSACLAKGYYVFISDCDVNIEKMQTFVFTFSVYFRHVPSHVSSTDSVSEHKCSHSLTTWKVQPLTWILVEKYTKCTEFEAVHKEVWSVWILQLGTERTLCLITVHCSYIQVQILVAWTACFAHKLSKRLAKSKRIWTILLQWHVIFLVM